MLLNCLVHYHLFFPSFSRLDRRHTPTLDISEYIYVKHVQYIYIYIFKVFIIYISYIYICMLNTNGIAKRLCTYDIGRGFSCRFLSERTWSSRLRNSWPWMYVKACLGLGLAVGGIFRSKKWRGRGLELVSHPGRLTAGTWEYGPPGKGKSSEPNHHFQVPAVNLPGCSGLYVGGIPHPRCQWKNNLFIFMKGPV